MARPFALGPLAAGAAMTAVARAYMPHHLHAGTAHSLALEPEAGALPEESKAATGATPPSTEEELSAALLSHRRLFLLGDVTDDSANALVKRLLWLEATAPGEPIELVINSSGGSLWAGFALFDTMRAISSPVHTCCIGRCRSMAAVLLAAGEPGHRYASESARLMIHQPYWDSDAVGSYSQADDLKVQAHESDRQRQHWAATLAALTGSDAAALDSKMVRDVNLTAAEAKEMGLIDHILGGMKGEAGLQAAPERKDQSSE